MKPLKVNRKNQLFTYIAQVFLVIAVCTSLPQKATADHFSTTIPKIASLNHVIALFKQPNNSVQANNAIHRLMQNFNSNQFCYNTIPSPFYKSLTQRQYHQFCQTLTKAVTRTLYAFFNNASLKRVPIYKVMTQNNHKTIFYFTGFKNRQNFYYPLVLKYQYLHHWQLTDFIVYTTFLSKAYHNQLVNAYAKTHRINKILVALHT